MVIPPVWEATEEEDERAILAEPCAMGGDRTASSEEPAGRAPGRRPAGDCGILHVLKTCCRQCDCSDAYGPHTTIYNRFHRWSHRRFWLELLESLAASGAVTKSTAIDST